MIHLKCRAIVLSSFAPQVDRGEADRLTRFDSGLPIGYAAALRCLFSDNHTPGRRIQPLGVGFDTPGCSAWQGTSERLWKEPT